MLSKRKFENLVTHGDFTFYGNIKIADQLTIPVEVDLATSSVPQTAIISDSGWINDLTTNIPQTSIIPSSGWIIENITNLQNTMYDSIDAVYSTCLSKESAENLYTTKQNPTLFGTVTFNAQGTTITDYLKKLPLNQRMRPKIILFLLEYLHFRMEVYLKIIYWKRLQIVII